MLSKRHVRQEALRARRSLTAEQVGLLSSQIQEALVVLPEFLDADVIASYVSKKDEVQTSGILLSAFSSGKRVLVPRSDPASMSLFFHEIESLDQLAPGSFGVLEPPVESKVVPLSESQLVIVPVVAWDGRGRRVGYGKGYFDRGLKSRGMAVCAGLAFESQRWDFLPTTPSDVPLDIMVTERRVLRFGRTFFG